MQPDPKAATDFYGALFGWTFENQLPDDAPGQYLVARLRGSDVAAIGGPSDPSSPAPFWNTYTAVDSVDDTVRRVLDAGGNVISEPNDVLDAGRMAVCADPEGAVFSIWEAREFFGAQIVNEPGSWNFSELNTRDRDAAARFYNRVFGWEVETFGMGDASYSIFKLPGYGKFLMQLNPELRGQVEGDGAPGGFIDAVALVAEPQGDEVPAHWSVTFAVDDADDTAARAAALGGKVMVPPFDVEPVRMTVIADPQGAVFTASKYQPTQ
jgi:predicted enzyme related to lactoylglutathione lyase